MRLTPGGSLAAYATRFLQANGLIMDTCAHPTSKPKLLVFGRNEDLFVYIQVDTPGP